MMVCRLIKVLLSKHLSLLPATSLIVFSAACVDDTRKPAPTRPSPSPGPNATTTDPNKNKITGVVECDKAAFWCGATIEQKLLDICKEIKPTETRCDQRPMPLDLYNSLAAKSAGTTSPGAGTGSKKCKVINITSVLIMRKTPEAKKDLSNAFPAANDLALGAEVDFVESKDGWTKVKSSSAEGWVCSSCESTKYLECPGTSGTNLWEGDSEQQRENQQPLDRKQNPIPERAG
jgi:hypothetical protein